MMANLFPISLCLLVLAMGLTVFGQQFDLDWLNVLGALFALIGAVTMIVFVITMFSNDVKYEAVSDGETWTSSKCYKDNGYNVCEEMVFNNKKVVVDDYWKK